jgi:hypothetical protein
MIDISVLRTMVKHGATMDMLLAVLEADQIARERKGRERANRRIAAKMGAMNGHRTLQQAADDLLRTAAAAGEAPRSARN